MHLHGCVNGLCAGQSPGFLLIDHALFALFRDADRQAGARHEEVEDLGDHERKSRAIPTNHALNPGPEKSGPKAAPLGLPSIRGES